jgi:nucleoside 2-deoxyribosyltransferase
MNDYRYDQPPMVYMYVDTKGKTKEQLKIEVTERLETEVEVKMESVRDCMEADEFDLIKSMMIDEKNKILESFLKQIDSFEIDETTTVKVVVV